MSSATSLTDTGLLTIGELSDDGEDEELSTASGMRLPAQPRTPFHRRGSSDGSARAAAAALKATSTSTAGQPSSVSNGTAPAADAPQEDGELYCTFCL